MVAAIVGADTREAIRNFIMAYRATRSVDRGTPADRAAQALVPWATGKTPGAKHARRLHKAWGDLILEDTEGGGLDASDFDSIDECIHEATEYLAGLDVRKLPPERSPGERLSPVFYGGVRTDGDVAENLRSVATATLAQLDRSLPAGMADRGMVLRFALWLERDGRPS